VPPIRAEAASGRGATREWECFRAVEGLVLLEAMVELAEEFVEQWRDQTRAALNTESE
jgi:hypothetical protein